MKKKYGFTLVELLVVIVIVGILLLIAVPSVSKYLKRGTKEYYSNLENTVMLAGRDYFNDYRTLLPRAVDNVTVIELDELVENKYIDKVVDKNGKTCSGRVIAKKIRKSEYEYYTCLICEDYKAEEEIEACSYDENQNVTLETKYYRIDVEKDYYEVNQGESFTLPYGKVYYTKNGKEELINDKIEGKPKTIDTNKLGTTTVTYYYKGAKKEIIVNVKDVVKPSAPEIVLKYDNENGKVYKEGTWSNSNIYAEFQSTDYTKPGVVGSGISRYEISEDNKVTYNYLNSNNKLHEPDQNKTYYVRSIDKANNISESNEYMIMIDRNSPSCSITADGTKTSQTNEWYTGNVSLIFNPTDNLSGVAISSITVKKNDKVVKITNNTITENGIYTVEGSVTDNAGNLSTCSIKVKIDQTAPNAPTLAISDNIISGSWHKAAFTITASGASNISGNTYYYGTSSSPTTKGTVQSVSSNTRSTTYYFKVCSGAGICSTTSSYVAKLDQTTPNAPTLAISDNITSGNWHKAAFTITASGASNISGNTYYYGTSSSPTTKGTVQSVSSNTRSTTYYFKVCSGAGICSTTSSYVAKLDQTTPNAPTLAISDNITSGNWHKAAFTITASGASNISGNTYYYGTSSSPTTKGTVQSVSSNTSSTTYYFKVCSGAGICSTTSSYVAKLDQTTPNAPTLAISDNITSGNWHKAAFTITAGGASNISGNTYSWWRKSDPTDVTVANSLERTANTSGATYYFKVCSGAGLCSESSKYVAKLDKNDPTVTTSVSESTATFTFKDNIGVVGYGVNKSSTTPPTYTSITSTTSTTQTYTATEDGTYYVWVKDAAGRTNKAKFEIDFKSCNYKFAASKSFSCTSTIKLSEFSKTVDLTYCNNVTMEVTITKLEGKGCACGATGSFCYCHSNIAFGVGNNEFAINYVSSLRKRGSDGTYGSGTLTEPCYGGNFATGSSKCSDDRYSSVQTNVKKQVTFDLSDITGSNEIYFKCNNGQNSFGAEFTVENIVFSK